MAALTACDAQKPSYIDRVWRVTESESVQPGTLYVLLSEGTLVVASEGNRPAFGRWQRQGDELAMIEDGQSYPIETLELTEDRWRIRSHNPGQPVEITLVSAQP
jgi:hypothetical protein